MRPKFILLVVSLLVSFFLISFAFVIMPNVGGSSGTKVRQLRAGYCVLLGGEMKVTDCNFSGCNESCKFKFRDGGKACKSSNDCSGRCVVTKPIIYGWIIQKPPPQELSNCRRGKNQMFDCTGQNFESKCQVWPQGNCESVWEYNNGIVKKLPGSCTM